MTRRIVDLEEKGYVGEVTSVTKAEARKLGIAKSKKVCLTKTGVQKGEEIYKKYGPVCLQLLRRLPPEKLKDAWKAEAFYEAVMAARRFRA